MDDIVDALFHTSCKPIEKPPKAIFTFLGPSLEEKIYLAKSLADLFKPPLAFKHIEMEQYADPENSAKLLGLQAAYEGAKEGDLVRFVRENPLSVILFDNIDQADNQVQVELLDLITSNQTESGLDCTGLIVIFTTALGSSFFQTRAFLDTFKQNKLRAQAIIMDAIAKEKKAIYDIIMPSIAPKLLPVLARNYIIFIKKLNLEALVRLGAESLARFAENFMEKSNISLSFQDSDQLVKIFILSFAPDITIKKILHNLPDLILFKITPFVRDAATLPTKITFKLAKEAEVFLARLSRESDNLLQRLFKKNETIDIAWKETIRGKHVVLSLVHAERKKLAHAREFYREEKPYVEFSTVGFDEIAGNATIKKTLKQIINILKHPALVKRYNIDMPKGMLLVGATGVGKTMLSKAFAKEADLPYIYASRSDLFDPLYLRMVYQKAREFAPSIVFLDGIDVKGLVEGVYANMPADQLIAELDAVSTDPVEFVFTIATATNRDEVSSLITAPGRIDIFVEVPELDREARRFFIKKVLEKPNDGKIDIDKVVRYISGMNGYDLQRIGKEVSLAAIRNGRDCITEEILIEQINIIKYGSKLEKKHIRNFEKDLRLTAYHEAAHAVLSYLLLPDIKIEQVTIAPRQKTLGFISYTAEEFPGNFTKEEIFNNICVLMSGRMANIKKYGEKGINSGAVNDLEEATHQAYLAIASLGMDEELGFVHVDTLAQNVNKRLFQDQVENRVRHWISLATEKARELVDQHWDKIEKLAQVLLRREIVDGAELGKLMRGEEIS